MRHNSIDSYIQTVVDIAVVVRACFIIGIEDVIDVARACAREGARLIATAIACVAVIHITAFTIGIKLVSIAA